MPGPTVDKPTDAIAALLQERHRFEQWLAVLESRRPSTPPHVYDRVRADYEGRLGRVVDELGGRSADLRQVVESLAQHVNTLQTEENAKRDLQAEAELRAAVGEYSPEQWRELSQASESEIARISGQRAEAAAELAQIQQLLTMATAQRMTPPTPSGHPAPAAGPTARPGDRTGDRAAPAPAGRAAPPPPPPPPPAAPAPAAAPPVRSAPAPSHGFDELAFLQSVVDAKGDLAKAPPAAAPGPPPAPAPAAARTSATPQDAAAVGASVPAHAPSAPNVPSAAGGANGPAAAPAGQSAGRRPVTDSVPVFLRDVPSEQIKTLKCAECGTMNYPTEWYCERCGGELAAM